ncbi:PglL family O-oligosaccharyltransferase [Pseudomonas leptonychotis]|uniref:PglL family O-oligosaccharyltransferase n=1 Tax=Pseudomonas leptonychotis TaxID=2448482 RepID=UPI0010AAB421|nr:O-antigen ligase family protein [Pseudomonas leptonychotis]
MHVSVLGRYCVLIAGAIFLLSWVLPNHYYPWSSAYQEFASFLAVAILVLGAISNCYMKVPASFLFFVFVAFVPLVQFAFGRIYFFSSALLSFLYLIGFFFALVVGCVFFRSSRNGGYLLDVMVWAFMLGAVISIWIALKQWLLLSGSIWIVDMPPGGRPFANLAQPNNLATLLGIGVLAVLYAYEKSWFGRYSAGILVLFLLFGVALTQSRTPWLAFMCVAFFWFVKRRSYKFRVGSKVVFFWLVYYCACVVALPFISSFLMLDSTSLAARAQSFERLALWWQFILAIWHGPFWGYGWGQVGLAQVEMSSLYPVQMLTAHSHNVVLDLMLWNGPVLGLIIVVFLFFWFLRMALNARSLESTFALSVACLLLTHGMLELPLEYAYFLLPLGVLLGGVAAEHHNSYEIIFSKKMISVILVLSMSLLVVIWREYRLLEEDYRLMRFESARIGFLKADQPAPDVLLLTEVREFLRFARTDPAENMSKEQLQWMREVAHRPAYAPSLLRYALSLGLNGEPELASKQLQLLRELHGPVAYENSLSYLRALEPEHPQLGALLK